MGKETDTSVRYRKRAEELRAIADTIRDRGNREVLLRMAEDYDERADLAGASDKIIPFPKRVPKRSD